MTPSNELINEWLKAAEAAPGPRFLTFATLAAAWGAERQREACATACESLAKDHWDEMAYRALQEAAKLFRAGEKETKP